VYTRRAGRNSEFRGRYQILVDLQIRRLRRETD
jgi:hypothetical protein